MSEIDAAWCAANPLPALDGDTDKDSRGRVLMTGGAADVPGALLLTGEAALRVGAGKVRLATVASAALGLGLRFPEAAVLALPEEAGEIADAGPLADYLARVDALVLGPGMGDKAVAIRLVRAVAAMETRAALVLDAAAVAGAADLVETLRAWRGRLVLTPHCGEMASLCACDIDAIRGDPAAIATKVAVRFGAVVVLKDAATVIASPDGNVLRYPGGGPGLGTGGSGDVLAGAIAGLLARGAAPVTAAAWGVWLHGEAGRRLARRVGPVGFLARELLPELPALLPR